MQIENELFERYEANIDKLNKYGFKKEGKKLVYKKNILDDKFTVVVEYDKEIKGRVIEVEFDEEYTNFRREEVGEFSAKIKEAFIDVLKDIRNKCFTKHAFKMNQTRRINDYMINKYNVNPEFLWDVTPDYAVYRQTKKWFALIGSVEFNKLDKKSDIKDKVEIINLKVPEEQIDEIISKDGYYAAYHMNKRNWITIVLDDTLSDDDVTRMIDISYNLVNEQVDWLIPANPKYYDLVKAFNENNEIMWKQSSDINVGDIVYIYVGSPYSKVMYKCKALEVNIPYEYKDNNLSMKHVMRIELLKKLEDKNYTFEYLNKLGIRAIRGPRKITKNISNKLN